MVEDDKVNVWDVREGLAYELFGFLLDVGFVAWDEDDEPFRYVEVVAAGYGGGSCGYAVCYVHVVLEVVEVDLGVAHV